MGKVLVVLGTRPEIIKLAPLIRALKKDADLQIRVCVFRQHGAMLDRFLKTFDIVPDFDLPISISDKEVFSSGTVFGKRLRALGQSIQGFWRYILLLRRERPDLLVVQGDTATVLLSALVARIMRVPIVHVEAGLRTYDRFAPFPEEIDRQVLGRIATLHFAPTEEARKNLLGEKVPSENIYVVGNTEIDSLLWITERYRGADVQKEMQEELEREYGIKFDKKKKLLLVTAHRRESFGAGLQNICAALKALAVRNDVLMVYPVHPNPNVQKTVYGALRGIPNIILTPPLAYEPFTFLMSHAYLILTDSGGIQESAPSLGKPVLVMREKTERNEGIEAGVAKLVGTSKEGIVTAAQELLDDPKKYAAMTRKPNPYGDGTAAEKIAAIIRSYLAAQRIGSP